MNAKKPQLTILGDKVTLNPVLALVSSAIEIKNVPYDKYVVGDDLEGEPAIIICNTVPKDVASIELAQSLRMQYSNAPIYLVLNDRLQFDRTTLQKNGFTDAFLLPNDSKTLQIAVERDAANVSQGAVKIYREIQLVDIEPGVELGFDLYVRLPANNKYIRYVSGRDSLDEVRAKKLSQHSVNSASISEYQMKDFYKFSADRLKRMGTNDALSETEKIERKGKAVRALLSGFFGSSADTNSFDQGRRVLQDCSEIVKTYIVGDKTNSWYERFLKISSQQNGSYNHASNVSSLACMIAIGIGYSDVEDIGLAGLLHDIGTAELPPEIAAKTAEQRTADENLIYYTHANKSVDMIKNKKMIVSEKVLKIILQHHERYDGRGYPNNVSGDRLCEEAQILQIADELEKVISEKPGQRKLTPQESIFSVLNTEMAANIGRINPQLSNRILTLFEIKKG